METRDGDYIVTQLVPGLFFWHSMALSRIAAKCGQSATPWPWNSRLTPTSKHTQEMQLRRKRGGEERKERLREARKEKWKNGGREGRKKGGREERREGRKEGEKPAITPSKKAGCPQFRTNSLTNLASQLNDLPSPHLTSPHLTSPHPTLKALSVAKSCSVNGNKATNESTSMHTQGS
jgi:hypothetical protein